MANENYFQNLNIAGQNFKVSPVWEQLGLTKSYLLALLSRDFYTPRATQAPSSTDVYYTDPADGNAAPFREGQCCVYPDSESSDGWGFSIAKHIETDAEGLPTSIVWQRFINEAPMGKKKIYSLFGLSVQ